MEEAGDTSPLGQLTGNNASGVSQDNGRKTHCRDLSTDDMDNKENLCSVSENRSDFSAIAHATPQTRRAGKGRGCNLRKSLAWNKAFFTEEGVLDPSELSILSGSATKSSVNFLTVINEEMSPFTRYGASSRVNSERKVHPGSAFNDKKNDNLCSTSEPLGHEDTVPHVVPIKSALAKGSLRNIPCAPAPSSQKRLANISMSIPASKLPKFTATKSLTSSLTSNAKCSELIKGHSNQNAKPANTEQNPRSKGSSLSLKKALNYPITSSKTSERVYEKKTVNEDSSSADMQTSDLGKCTSSLKMPPKDLPPIKSSSSAGISNLEKVAYSFSQSAQQIQAGHPPAQGQAKPSGLRMPTPSLAFFGQAKIPPQTSGTFDHRSQYSRKYNSLKHTAGSRTLHPSHGQGQPCGSESTGTTVRAIRVSTPSSTENTDRSGNFIAPSVTNPFLRAGISQDASNRKILRFAIKSQISSCEENCQELHSDCLSDEGNIGKQSRLSSRQGPIHEPESSKDLVLSTDNNSLPVERNSVNILTQANHFGNADGIYLACEGQSNVISHKCSPKQLQQEFCGTGESPVHQQCEDARKATISAVDKGLPHGKHDLCSSLSFENAGEGIDRCPLLEAETSLRSSKTQVAGSASLQLPCSSTENIASSVVGDNTECAVHCMEQYGLNTDTVLLEEVHSLESEKNGHQSFGISFQRKKNQIASQNEREVIVEKQELMEKPKQVSIGLNQLKAAPFSDEWVAALESFGEGILQMKTGAVQNSPQDKPVSEPGPWSPVKRKNQDLGPYDCTKHSKSLSSSSGQ